MGYKLPDDQFERIWKIGTEKVRAEMLCVETFWGIFKENVLSANRNRSILEDKEVKC